MQPNVLFTSCSWSTRSEKKTITHLEKLYRLFEKYLGKYTSDKNISGSVAKKTRTSLEPYELESDTNSVEDSSRRSSMLSTTSGMKVFESHLAITLQHILLSLLANLVM